MKIGKLNMYHMELVMKDFNDSELKNYLSKISDKILYAYQEGFTQIQIKLKTVSSNYY